MVDHLGIDKLGETLPGDWRIIKHFTENQTGHESATTMHVEVESNRFGVVLHGSWPWIMKEITSRMLSSKV